jgi:hypothetical protein
MGRFEPIAVDHIEWRLSRPNWTGWRNRRTLSVRSDHDFRTSIVQQPAAQTLSFIFSQLQVLHAF